MSSPEPERPRDATSEPDARAAAREAAAAARTLGRQLRILLSGAGRWGLRQGGGAARGAAAGLARLSGTVRRARRAGPDTTGRRRLTVGSILVIAFALALSAVSLYVLAALLTLPRLGSAASDPGQRALTVEADDGRVFATRGAFRGQPLTAADLPPHLEQAIIAIEDRRFHSHWGVDLRGLLRATWRNLTGGGVREGGSTITQQYVRLTSLSQEKTLRRKIQEAVLALRAETEMSKGEILLGYLNTAYFGAGAYGVDAAARRYFGKPAKALTLPEAAMLAGLVRAPSQLAPTRNFGGAKERADVVLQAMVETGAITAQEGDAARAQTVTLRTPPETPPGTNYFLDMVAGDARRLSDAPGDLTVRTTLNLDLQSLAEGVIARRLDAEGARKKVGQAALVALSPQGAILAMVGGRDYEDSQFNRAVQAKRQAGSLFKLFVYLTAYAQGLGPDSVLVDRPVQIGDWEPQNANNRFRGAMPLRTAFAQSVNTIAAQLGDELGMPAVIATARSLGVQSELPNVPSLALGAAEVTLLEMTRAYAGVLADRTPLDSYAIHAIRGGGPQPLYLRPEPARAAGLPGDSRSMMLESLQAVVDSGTGRGARVPGLAVGGKTGTTQDYRDAWFVGLTPELIVGVWVGNDDNSSMNRVSGGDLPAAIFRDFVQRASAQLAKGRKRPSAARAEPQPAALAPAAPAGAEARGVPEVVDTGTLAFRGRVVRLAGVQGEGGVLARQLARYLRRREVVCTPDAAEPQGARCRIDGDDLAALILAAGGARASETAPSDLLAAEEQARSERVGLWGRGR